MTGATTPSASIVVCTTPERADSLARTLDGLRWLDYPAYEVLVVTSGFGAAPPPAVPDDVRVVDGGEARNLSVARNAGIRAARGELVLFIDDDAIPEPNWARALAEGLADPEVAAAGGPVFDPSGARLQVRYSLANALGAARALFDGPNPSDLHGSPYSDWAVYTIGTNSGFRREALVAIGGFDEEYEYYLDETDVCRRLLARGWLVRALDAGYVHHGFLPNELRGESRAIARRYSVFKNRAYFAYSHGRDHHGAAAIATDLAAFADLHRDDCALHIAAGNLPPETAQVLEEEVVAGYDDGFAAFVRGPRTRPPAWFSATPEPLVQLRTLRAAQPLHVAFIAPEWPPLPMFGIARVVRTLAASLAERGHVVRVLTPTAGPPEVAFEGRVWVHRVPPAARSGVALHPVAAQARAFAAELAAVEERLPIDLVQVPNWDAPGLEAIAEGRWRVVVGLYTPVLAMVESDHRFDTRDALIRLLEARELALYASATAFLACGARIVDEIERDYGVRLRDRPVGVVPHGLPDLARPEPAPIGDGSVRILCVGRLEPRKGTDVLLEAAARVLAEAPDTRLDIVGDAGSGGHARSYPSLWRELAGGSEVEARTTFLGQVDNATLLRHYARADVVVVPSRFESFGLTAIEAMRFGVPAVVTATGEMQDIVADAGCGLVVPPADADALATALLELVRSPERRRVLGETGRTAFAQRYTRERMAEEVERFYREVRRDAQPATGLVPALAGALAAAAPEPLDRVACPTCHGPVEARADLLAGGRPWSATLRCAACAAPVGAIRHGMVDARAGTLPGDAPAAAGPPLELPALRRRRLRAAAPEVEASGAWAVIDGGRRAAVEGARLEVEVVCASAGALLRRVPDGGTARLHVDGAHVADVDLDGAGEELEVELLAGSAPARHVLAVEIAAPAPGGRRGPVHVAGFALDVVALDGLDDVPQPGRGQAQAAPPAAVASRLVDLPPGAAVLQLGGATPRWAPGLVRFGWEAGDDVDVIGDAHRLPFADDTFEVVLADRALERLERPGDAVAELLRVARPGGVIVVEAAHLEPPNGGGTRLFGITPDGLARLFAGCEVLETDWSGGLATAVRQLLHATGADVRAPRAALAELERQVQALDALVTHDDVRAVAARSRLVARKPRPQVSEQLEVHR